MCIVGQEYPFAARLHGPAEWKEGNRAHADHQVHMLVTAHTRLSLGRAMSDNCLQFKTLYGTHSDQQLVIHCPRLGPLELCSNTCSPFRLLDSCDLIDRLDDRSKRKLAVNNSPDGAATDLSHCNKLIVILTVRSNRLCKLS